MTSSASSFAAGGDSAGRRRRGLEMSCHADISPTSGGAGDVEGAGRCAIVLTKMNTELIARSVAWLEAHGHCKVGRMARSTWSFMPYKLFTTYTNFLIGAGLMPRLGGRGCLTATPT
jgi:hypothetical protein